MGKALGIIALLAAILAVILLAPSSTQAPGPVKPGGSGSEFKAALVTPGAINDGGWSQNAYNGLLKMKQELHAEVANTVAGSANEAFSAFRDYSNRNFDLVIGHASEWFDAQTLEIAAAHPKTTFLI